MQQTVEPSASSQRVCDECRTLLAKGMCSYKLLEFSKSEFYWRLVQGVSNSGGYQDYGALFVASCRLSFLYYRQMRIGESKIAASQALSIFNIFFHNDSKTVPQNSPLLTTIIDKLHSILFDDFHNRCDTLSKSQGNTQFDKESICASQRQKYIYSLSTLKEIRNVMIQNGKIVSSKKGCSSSKADISDDLNSIKHSQHHQIIHESKCIYTISQLKMIRNDMIKNEILN